MEATEVMEAMEVMEVLEDPVRQGAQADSAALGDQGALRATAATLLRLGIRQAIGCTLHIILGSHRWRSF